MTEDKTKKHGENPAPLYAFPGALQKIMKELHEERLYPLEFIVGGILYVVSILIGAGSVLTTILGKTIANVYIAIIGDQGSNKSTPVEYLLMPLLEADNAAIKEHNEKVAAWEKMDLKYRQTHAEEDDPGPYPICRRLICNDITPEALLDILSKNQMGVGHYYDELSRLFDSFRRYSKNASGEDIILDLFSGKPITVDRTTHKEILSVLRPYYSLIGTIQPQRFIAMMHKNDRYESGLFSRFIPAIYLENEPLKWSLEEDLPSGVDARYRQIIDKLLARREVTEETPAEYRLSDEAEYTIQSWQNEHEDRIAQYGHDSDRAVFRKIQLYVMKFALIIQVLWDVVEEVENPDHIVSAKTAILATGLANYYYYNSKEIARSVSKSNMTKTEQSIYAALPDRFTTAEGLAVAKRFGLGKTCFHAFLNKVKGVLLEQPSHGEYIKKETPKVV